MAAAVEDAVTRIRAIQKRARETSDAADDCAAFPQAMDRP